jgi:hypothetical protein
MHAGLHCGLCESQKLRCTLTLDIQEAAKSGDFLEGVVIGFDDGLCTSIYAILRVFDDPQRLISKIWMVYEGVLVLREIAVVVLHCLMGCADPAQVSRCGL